MNILVDTHAHLEELPDLEESLNSAISAGVERIIAVGSDQASNERVLQIASKHTGLVYGALGLHPQNLEANEVEPTLAFIDSHATQVVAIGEIGLDYHKRVLSAATKDFQKQVLSDLLDIASRHDKPVLIHSRYAWRDCLTLAEHAGVQKCVFHWFTGPSSVLRDIVGLGYYLSATPAVEYHEEHRRAVREAPMDRLLLETDSPVTYQRGSDSEFEARPADVIRSMAGAATLKGCSEGEIAESTTANAGKLFGFAPEF